LIPSFLRGIPQSAFAPEGLVPKFPESLRKIGPYLNIGGMFLGCMVVGVLLGWWLDRELDTKPWMLLAGSLLGMASGFYHFFKVVLGKGADKKNE
jgi:F0F1-type ATP synthase assembly protein I